MTDDDDFERSATELERARRRRIVSDARATIARLRREAIERHELERQPGPDLAKVMIPAPEDRVAKWRREAEERIAAREAERAKDDLIYRKYDPPAPVQSRAGNDWNEWLTRAIDARLEQERALIFDIVGEVIGTVLEEHKRADHKGDDLSTEVARLWRSFADLQSKLAELHRDRGVDRALRGTTIDAKTIN
jgi:hypothetical protein